MAGYQYTIIIGNVGRDPEMRYTQSGVAVCDFSVAVSRRWTDRTTNERREQTTWFRVTAWRALAETVNQYVHKGMQIMVTGMVEASAFMGQDGQPRASLDLTAQDVQFLGQRGDAMESSGEGYPEDAQDLPF
ncbi:single-stranded DNA-binding protein [Aggregatilinea lenta]|uniref:single-stranded DNA-binding protein n=1 Tax=Aggregatilinea lenta TaxID=913108 RepID=UPI000E5C4C0D|nr:single-stranded DNA-binding protein [Aggregatilinea lenta]